MSFWTEYVRGCKSRLSAIGRSLLASRNRWKEVALRRRSRVLQLKEELLTVAQERDALQIALENVEQQNEQLRLELARTRQEQSPALPDDPPLPHHQYGPRMISLCVNLARAVGLRASIRALKLFLDWIKLKVCLPTWQAVRIWMQRIGIARTKGVKKKEGRIWIVDHSNQIGQEKVLLLLGVHSARLPAPDRTLKQSDVEVLACIPGTNWKREDVARIYQDVAEEFGKPEAVLTDGAVELHESVNLAKWPGKKPPITLRDFKHFLANRLEATLKRDRDFADYSAELAKTRCAIQQTELSHLTPPSNKSKARFMNLKPFLAWGKMLLWYANTQESQRDDGVTQERVQEKLGWIKKYARPLQRWNAYQEAISVSLTWINRNGLRRGSARELKKILHALPEAAYAKSLINDAVEFVRSQEKKLTPGSQSWLSTEVIESAFAVYKQFEGQHCKGGFTTLLPTLASLLNRTTAHQVSQALKQVPVKSVRAWIENYLPNTNQAKRRRVAQRYRKSTKTLTHKTRATKKHATI